MSEPQGFPGMEKVSVFLCPDGCIYVENEHGEWGKGSTMDEALQQLHSFIVTGIAR